MVTGLHFFKTLWARTRLNLAPGNAHEYTWAPEPFRNTRTFVPIPDSTLNSAATELDTLTQYKFTGHFQHTFKLNNSENAHEHTRYEICSAAIELYTLTISIIS